jgi:ABC-type multidrug transport system fused ATPase/permease subunit
MFSLVKTTYGPLWKLLRRTGTSRARLVFTLCLMLGAGLLESATVGLLVPLLSTLTGGTDATAFLERFFPAMAHFSPGTRVLVLCAGIFAVVLARSGVGILSAHETGRTRRLALVALRRLIFERLLRAPPSLVESKTTGEITGAFTVEAGRANRALEYTLALSQRAVIAVGYTCAIAIISLRLTAATLVLGVFLGVLTLLVTRRSLGLSREVVGANAALGREVSETVGGFKVVRATAAEDRRHETFARANEAQAQADVAMSVTAQRSSAFTEALGVAGAMGLTAGAHALWIATGTLEVAHFLAFGFGLLRLLPAVNQTYGMHTAVVQLTGSLEKMLTWLDLPTYPSRPFGTRTLDAIRDGVRVEGLSYAYVEGQPVLREVSFELRAGETVAILGTSGSGKTTFASLLLRLREPTAGTIAFDGVSHWDFSPESFHRGVALVEQEPFMFNCSVAENVAYGAPWVTRADVEAAIQKVQLADVIRQLPEGYDTVLGERGATLSGGQRQRLAIARAIVRNPVLLVLDEPTSALDSETEKEVVAAIDAASAGRTTVIITHRPSTVEHATRVVRLARGGLEGVDVRERAALEVG